MGNRRFSHFSVLCPFVGKTKSGSAFFENFSVSVYESFAIFAALKLRFLIEWRGNDAVDG